MKRRLLIDADILLFKAAAVSEFEADWGDDVWVVSGNLALAKDAFQTALQGVCEALGTTELVLAMSDSTSFRKRVYEAYKANRKATRKPVTYKPLKAWAADVYQTILKPDLEADDVLGIVATKPSSSGWENVIVSEDKDLLTIPGKLYRQGELIEVTPEEANYQHLYQTLIGDATDGYPGCPGIGPVKAEKLLKTHPTWDTVRLAYEKAGLTEDDALVQARMARILRWSEWDPIVQKPKLWTPHKES